MSRFLLAARHAEPLSFCASAASQAPAQPPLPLPPAAPPGAAAPQQVDPDDDEAGVAGPDTVPQVRGTCDHKQSI